MTAQYNPVLIVDDQENIRVVLRGMLEAGQTLPSIPALILIAERLGMTADELIRVVNGS